MPTKGQAAQRSLPSFKLEIFTLSAVVQDLEGPGFEPMAGTKGRYKACVFRDGDPIQTLDFRVSEWCVCPLMAL